MDNEEKKVDTQNLENVDTTKNSDVDNANKDDKTCENCDRDVQDTQDEKVEEKSEDKNSNNIEEEKKEEKDPVIELQEILKFYEKKIKNLEDDLRKYKNESETYKERLTNLNSEYENYRNRTTKEKEEIKDFATMDILKTLLPVFDALERADAKDDTDASALANGIDVTLGLFRASLDRLNVEEVPNEGELNPSYHEVVMHEGDTLLPKKVVKQVLQKGYKMKDSEKVLRHAMIISKSVEEE